MTNPFIDAADHQDRNRAFIPQLWRALPRRRAHQHELCRIDRAPSDQQALLQEQQMQWIKRGAHLLLQTWVQTLNQELGAVFQRWYPDM